MLSDPRYDARAETSKEVLEVRHLAVDPANLKGYWDDAFRRQYLDILEQPAEVGRHGVIAEIVNRLALEGPILDAGCGTGILSSLLDLSKFGYIGCDISSVAIEYARRTRSRPNADFRVEEIETLTVSKPLSAIVFNEVLYYVDAPAVLEKMPAWLARDGVVVASIFDFPEGLELCSWLRRQFSILLDIAIENQEKGFRWHILAWIPSTQF